jgi:two-component sensor histidine kinase
LVPLCVGHEPVGTLWIVASEGHFNSTHAEVLRDLASFTGIALAISRDRRRLEDAIAHQELLLAEMNHRVKNLFLLMDGLIYLTKRSATSVAELATTLSGRLHALAAAHGLIRRSFGPAPDTPCLHALICAILKPYAIDGSARWTVDGPALRLGGGATTSMALVFHELATNAAKYGSLRHFDGHLRVTWRREEQQLAIRWQELGTPETGPNQQGFGSALIKNTVTRQLRGTFDLDWRERGLVADFQIPLAKLSE